MSSEENSLLDDIAMSTRAVNQPRRTKRNDIWQSRRATMISRAKGYLPQQAMMGVYTHSVTTNQQGGKKLAQPYIINQQQRGGPSGGHSRARDVQATRKYNRNSRISTMTSKTIAFLVYPCIQGDQQSESTPGTAGRDGCISPQQHNPQKRKCN